QADGWPGTERTDLWALGTILYECLTGKPAFKAAGRTETLELVRKVDPVPPRRLRPEVPAELEAVCLKCLEKGPNRRYPSAGALAAALDRWLQGRRTQARLPGALRRCRQWARRHPVRAGIAVAAVVLLAVTLAQFLRPPEQAGADGNPEQYAAEIEQDLADGKA